MAGRLGRRGVARQRMAADMDTKRYQDHYPGKRDNPRERDNLRFYQNRIPSQPRGAKIEEILARWYGDYDTLERHHGYIQWIFPIRESGMNMSCQELQLEEAAEMRADPEIRRRMIGCYKMMLDFYGMDLLDETVGSVDRSHHYRERYLNMASHPHNFLRITRILKSLGELGLEHLKPPFVQFVMQECFVTRELDFCFKALTQYWVHTLRDPDVREDLLTQLEAFMEAAPPDPSPPPPRGGRRHR